MEIIQKIVATEKDSEKLVQEARKKASQLLAGVDAESGEVLRKVRQEERDKMTHRIEEEESLAREAEEAAVREVQEKYLKAADESSDLLEKLAVRVAERITRTVFDKDRK